MKHDGARFEKVAAAAAIHIWRYVASVDKNKEKYAACPLKFFCDDLRKRKLQEKAKVAAVEASDTGLGKF